MDTPRLHRQSYVNQTGPSYNYHAPLTAPPPNNCRNNIAATQSREQRLEGGNLKKKGKRDSRLLHQNTSRQAASTARGAGAKEKKRESRGLRHATGQRDRRLHTRRQAAQRAKHSSPVTRPDTNQMQPFRQLYESHLVHLKTQLPARVHCVCGARLPPGASMQKTQAVLITGANDPLIIGRDIPPDLPASACVSADTRERASGQCAAAPDTRTGGGGSNAHTHTHTQQQFPPAAHALTTGTTSLTHYHERAFVCDPAQPGPRRAARRAGGRPGNARPARPGCAAGWRSTGSSLRTTRSGTRGP